MSRTPIILSFAAAALFAAAAAVLVPRGLEAGRVLTAQDDPNVLADHYLNNNLSSAVTEREIAAALAADDVDLARSFLTLAQDRGVAVDPVLADNIDKAETASASASRTAGKFVHGFITGQPDDLAGLAGTAVGDLFVFGDIRDALREGVRYARGEETDMLILGLAGAGLAITAGTYASLGAAAPMRAGLTLVKAARRTGRIGKPLLATLRLATKDGLVRVGRDVSRIQAKVGTRGAFDGIKFAEHPKDISRVARLAERQGGKTRAILKLGGRAAIMLTTGAFNLAMWLFSAALTLLGFCSAVKRSAERTTERYLHWRKARRLRALERALVTAPAAA